MEQTTQKLNKLEKGVEETEVAVEQPRSKLRTAGKYALMVGGVVAVGAVVGLAAGEFYNWMQNAYAQKAGEAIGQLIRTIPH